VSNSVFFQPMCNKVNTCLTKWENKKEVCVGDDIQKLTLDVLASCIFGLDFDTLNGKFSEPLYAYNYSFQTAFNPIRTIFPFLNKLPLKSNEEMYKNLKTFDKYCWQIMDETKKKMEEKKNQVDIIDNNERKAVSLIELMYENNLTEEIIRDNTVSFFLAGHETTAVSLSWLLTILVSHPEVQKKKPDKKSLTKSQEKSHSNPSRNFITLKDLLKKVLGSSLLVHLWLFVLQLENQS